MKRFFLIGTILFCAAVAWIVVEIVRRTYFEEKGSIRHLQRIASQINGLGPDQKSDTFDLTATAHSDRSLTLRYELVERSAAEFDDGMKRELREMFRRDTCEKKALRELLDSGATLRVLIVDSADAPILNTEVLRWECGGAPTAASAR